MATTGDDCYFYYYSECTKGDLCPFRHSSAALGNETMCTNWINGTCTRPNCRFRHMEIRKDRSSIQCYWETQPGGCTKPHCVFKHTALGLPPAKPASKPQVPVSEVPDSEPQTPEEEQSFIQTPTVDPIIFNPFEEESDQESVTASPMKPQQLKEVTLVPGKVVRTRKDDSPWEQLDFGVKTLSQLRERPSAPEEEEQDTEEALTEEEVSVASIGSRLGSRLGAKLTTKLLDHTSPVPSPSSGLKRRIIVTQEEHYSDAEPAAKVNIRSRLGLTSKKSNEEKPSAAQKGSIKSRLGLLSRVTESEDDKDTNKEIKLKTLEEIQREKAMKTIRSHIGLSDLKTSRSESDLGAIKVKTIEEIRREKALKRSSAETDGKVKTLADIRQAKLARLSPVQSEFSPDVESIKIKTLEEIQREKAKKTQTPAAGSNENVGKIKIKTLAEIRKEKSEKMNSDSEDSQKSSHEADLSDIKIKSLEEIRREKAKETQSLPSGIKVTVSSTSDTGEPSKVTQDEARQRQHKFHEIGQAWRSAAQEAESKIARLQEQAAHPSPKKLVRPERKIYRPPGRSKPEEPTTSEKPAQTKQPDQAIRKRVQGWGVKTFSEIMKAKQVRHTTGNRGDAKDVDTAAGTQDAISSSTDLGSPEETVESRTQLNCEDEPSSSEVVGHEVPGADIKSAEKPMSETPSVSVRRRSSAQEPDLASKDSRKSSTFDDSIFNDDEFGDLIGDATYEHNDQNEDDLLTEMDELLS